MRSYVFSIQSSVSHRIGNPVWIYNRTDIFFHITISSHYVLDNIIWLLLVYSHTGLFYLLLGRFGFCYPRFLSHYLKFAWTTIGTIVRLLVSVDISCMLYTCSHVQPVVGKTQASGCNGASLVSEF